MNDCEKYRELISSYIDGLASEDETAELIIHVASCEECSALLDAYTIVDSLFCEEEAAPPELKDSVMAEIHELNASRPARKNKRIVLGFLGAAACLALVMFSIRGFGRSDVNFAADSFNSSPAAESAPMAAEYENSFAADDDAEEKSAYASSGDAVQSGENTISDDPESDQTSPADEPAEISDGETDDPGDEIGESGSTIIGQAVPGDITFGDEYRAVVYMYGSLPDSVSQQGFYTFGIDDGVLGITIDLDTLAVLEDSGEYEIVYGNEEAGSALIVYTQEQ